MNYLIAYEISEDVLNTPGMESCHQIYAELEDFMLYKKASRISKTVWAVKPRSSRSTAKFIKNHILNSVLKQFDAEHKKHLRLFITPINEKNYATANPICDTDQGVRGMLEWYIADCRTIT